MKKILFLLLGFSFSAFALEQNPIAPPKAEIVDKFGVNLESRQLARTLKTVSIGGELGLSHSVQLYTDLFAEGNFIGFVDAFAGTVTPKNISENVINIETTGSEDNLTILRFTDTGEKEIDEKKRLSVMRAYGPAGSQDFLVYQNGVLNKDASATSGYTFKAVGDNRHSLVESADKSYLVWTTPDGIESKYTNFGRRLAEVTYPNGYKVRISYNGVTTNTGFMLKYQLNAQGLTGTPDQIVAINLANQYCSADAATSCNTTSWPTATFTWPDGTPSNFWTPDRPSSHYLVKLATSNGVTEIQYQPENMCIAPGFGEDENCSNTTSGLAKWSSRIRSIKTPESSIPNYQYTYVNIGVITNINNYGATGRYWSNQTRVGQINTAELNGTEIQSYNGPSNASGISTLYSTKNGAKEITVELSEHDLNVIQSVTNAKSGRYEYFKDIRHFVDKYYPVAGGGLARQYFYKGPRGNINQIKAIAPSTPMLLQEAWGYEDECIHPKICNKPTHVKDARGNVTEYEYDPQGRFGDPIKVTAPATQIGRARASTVYKYEQKYAYYKKDGETITRDPDPIWMIASEHTCRTSEITSEGCAGGDLDMVKTTYDYGPQNGQANNLLLRGKSVLAESGCSQGSMETRVWRYEYDKYGNRIGETQPKGNAGSTSCNP